ncbi:MAG TPA: protease inhibitor I42 family protein [Blastocatellia bacterium]|nr:protease inhibitor I42 family protein [Blastocatellia bacterium]
MRRLLCQALCLSILLCSVPELSANSQQTGSGFTVSRKAIWSPTDEMIQNLEEKCKATGLNGFAGCFISFMQSSGASPEAIQFAKLLNGEGYLRDFRKRLGVDVAYVTYPFRANENDAVLFVNGSPQIVDVDGQSVIQSINIKSDPVYAQLASKSSKLEIFPGDRSATDQPALERNTQGGQRFIVRYNVVNGCHACEIMAYALVAFDFTKEGKFIGTEFMGLSDQSTASVRPRMRFTNPRAIIDTRVGQQFSLVLFSNHSVGNHWELATPIDQTIVKLVDTAFEPPDPDQSNPRGKEVWTFIATQKGSTTISVKQVFRNAQRSAQATPKNFKIVIN